MVLILYMMIGAICDWKFYRIPNVLCLCSALTGMFFSYLEYGIRGVGTAAMGMVQPILVLYVLFYCHVLGAGDIKLLAASGTFLGKQIWQVILLSFLFNGIGAFVKMYRCGSLASRYYYLKGYLRDCRVSGKLLSDYEGGKDDKIHFSIGIFLACIAAFLLAGYREKVFLLTGIFR